MNPDIIIPTCKTQYEIAPLVCNLEGFSQGCRLIATSMPVSAAKNRNEGLRHAQSDIVIMLDDDIAGFFDGWWKELIRPLQEDPGIVMVSARLLMQNGDIGAMMFGGDAKAQGTTEVPRVPTACIAFRNEGLSFDEKFKGSGYEDDDFCAQLIRKHPYGRVVINNAVRLIHMNEEKNQHGEYATHNCGVFNRKWWTIRSNTVRTDKYWNIPRIIHFVWVGSDIPAWAQRNIDEFKRLNPDHEIKVHGENALDPVFSNHMKSCNDPKHKYAQISDLIRLSRMKHEGGWYWDIDFWPIVSIEEMCAAIKWHDPYNKLLCFGFKDYHHIDNGILGAHQDNRGLDYLFNRVVKNLKTVPWWGDYGTVPLILARNEKPAEYCVLPREKVIPITGKEAAMKAMANPAELERLKREGCWAVHFEMQSTIDVPGDLCTIQNTAKTNG
jgi:glycosyltransferase involved in cell wall biosynthesis